MIRGSRIASVKGRLLAVGVSCLVAALLTEAALRMMGVAYNLSFVDQAGADMTVVLPDSGTKLSTADLDKVVGGGLSARSTRARPSAGAGQKSITVDEILFDPY